MSIIDPLTHCWFLPGCLLSSNVRYTYCWVLGAAWHRSCQRWCWAPSLCGCWHTGDAQLSQVSSIWWWLYRGRSFLCSFHICTMICEYNMGDSRSYIWNRLVSSTLTSCWVNDLYCTNKFVQASDMPIILFYPLPLLFKSCFIQKQPKVLVLQAHLMMIISGKDNVSSIESTSICRMDANTIHYAIPAAAYRTVFA